MIRQDFIKRIIEELGRAVARLVKKQDQDPQAMLSEIEDALNQLPVVPGLLENTPPKRVVEALQDPQAVQLVAELYRLKSEQYKALGNTQRAVKAMRRSLALFEAAQRADSPTAPPSA